MEENTTNRTGGNIKITKNQHRQTNKHRDNQYEKKTKQSNLKALQQPQQSNPPNIHTQKPTQKTQRRQKATLLKTYRRIQRKRHLESDKYNNADEDTKYTNKNQKTTRMNTGAIAK